MKKALLFAFLVAVFGYAVGGVLVKEASSSVLQKSIDRLQVIEAELK